MQTTSVRSTVKMYRTQLPQHSIYNSRDKNLEQYHKDELQPTETFNRQWNLAIDALASFLKQNSGFSVAETVKGGSLGKGTAIRRNCDLDLVLFLNGYSTVGLFRQHLPDISRRLVQAIRCWDGGEFNVAVLEDKVRVVLITMNLVQSGLPTKVTLRLRVDIVPAFTRQEPSVLYQQMALVSADDRSYYSTSLAKQQTGFVSRRSARLKDLIRLVKDWRKTHLRENERGRPKIPKSYALELITIHVWESIGSPQRFELDRMLKLVLKHLVNSSYTNATWYDYYSVADANKYSRDTQVHRKPFILDPADPFHNVGADFDWTEISQMAEATFNSPRLRGVTEGV